jgi:hypothetical protein
LQLWTPAARAGIALRRPTFKFLSTMPLGASPNVTPPFCGSNMREDIEAASSGGIPTLDGHIIL